MKRYGPASCLEDLHPKQRAIVDALAEGLTDQQIAGRIGTHPRNVRAVIARIGQRLGERAAGKNVRCVIVRWVLEQ